MAIVSGYQKMKDYIKQSSGYKLLRLFRTKLEVLQASPVL